MGNFSFICGRHDQNHQIKDELCDKKHFILRTFAYWYYQPEKMNKRKLAVQYFACLVLVAFHLGCVLFYSSFSQPCHISLCAMCASSDFRCRFLGQFFFGFSCFGSGAAGLSPPGRSALASVPELHASSFRHATWLNFADFCSSGDFFAYRILLSTIVCAIAVLLVLVVTVSCLEVLGNNSCNPFYRWFSWGRTIVYPDAFVLHSKIYSRSVFDDVWWPIFIYGHTSQLFVSVTSNCCR